jgi:hypothetical protein
MNNHISIPPTAADAYRAMLAEQTYASLEEVTIENVDQLDEAADEENEFSHSKNKKQNYAKFLAANKDRVGKPMIDGGLKTNYSDADKVNGKQVNGVIYLGNGFVTFDDRDGDKVFTDIDPGYLNTSDGTVPWSTWKGYRGTSRVSAPASKFKEIAKLIALAAKV